MKPSTATYIIGTIDISGFHRHIASEKSDMETFSFLNSYYQAFEEALKKVDGRVIKHIGDSILFTARPDTAVNDLKRIYDHMNALLKEAHPETAASVRLHKGEVVEGTLGSGETAPVDIIGKAVNELFLIKERGFALSDALRSQ